MQQQGRVRVQPHPGHHGDEGGGDHDREGEIANAVERGRKVGGEEHGESLEHIDGGAREPATRPAQRKRQVFALNRGPDGGADRRQVACTGLVAVDQFVGIVARQLRLRRQVGKAIPVIAASGGKGVEVHLIK